MTGARIDPEVFDRVSALAVVPVVEIEDVARAVPLARTLAEAGLPVVEVTYRTEAAEAAVAAIAAELPDFLLGAGTLLTPELVRSASAAGARFGVAPGFSARCVAAAGEIGLPFIPGAVTPSEVTGCLDAGARYLKFFPASVHGGLAGLAALEGPFGPAGVRFMPTGGVNPGNAAEYLARPGVFAVGGTWVAPRADIAAGRWDAIAERARATRELRPVAAGNGGR
jgi:2-dehydro-3-deoxyphosphogluconate aldolase / (4S)-4-hydroxy-2-oxoglutarate aldolase